MSSIARVGPHVAVLSAQLDGDQESGYELTKTLRVSNPEIRVVLLLDFSDREAVVKAFRAGARGVFSRTGSFEALAKCIRSVHQGQVWANSHELTFLLEALSESATFSFPQTIAMNSLSRRERDVVRCVIEGLTNREIAQRLKLTEHTVKNYLFRIFDKLGVSSRVELVLQAFSLAPSSATRQVISVTKPAQRIEPRTAPLQPLGPRASIPVLSREESRTQFLSRRR